MNPVCANACSLLISAPCMKRFLLIILFWGMAFYIFFSFEQSASLDSRSMSEHDTLDFLKNTTRNYLNHLTNVNLRVDNVSPLKEQELFNKIFKDSNLPQTYWTKKQVVASKCLKFPGLYDLDFNNIYWQRLSALNATFYLLNAYYDKRIRVGNVPMVRILGMVNKINPPETFCQFWYEDLAASSITEAAVFSKASYKYLWNPSWGNYKDNILQPFIISCPVTKLEGKSYVPASVSLVRKQCDLPSNNLKVIYRRPKKREDFAVCVKGLDFLYEDISVRLVEWIELLQILGAKKIFMHNLEIHPNISKVLSYYIERDIIELTSITLPGEQPNLAGFRHFYLKSKLTAKRQNELIPYNDCLYKNLYSYKYVALLDTDEVIMPLAHGNWKDMMNDVVDLALKEKNYTRASYNFRNVYFLEDLQDGKNMSDREQGIPKYLHMLRHLYRSQNYTPPFTFVKCFHEVERIISLHNHFPINCFGSCTTYSVSTSIAHLQHYRKDCVESLKNACSDFRSYTMRDTSILRFKDDLIRRTTEILHLLGFF